MKDNRYQELKNENNEILSHLGPTYQNIANIYIKKARGYATKTIDTELKIQDVLKKLEDYDFRNVSISSVIPSDTVFIEDNVSKLSKELKDPNRYKTIIWLVVIALVIIAWFVLSIWMKSDTSNLSPTNVTYELISPTKIKIKWDENKLATEGYYVWYVDSNNVKKGKYETINTEFIFTIEEGKSYTFYVQTIKTEYLAESDPSMLKYPS